MIDFLPGHVGPDWTRDQAKIFKIFKIFEILGATLPGGGKVVASVSLCKKVLYSPAPHPLQKNLIKILSKTTLPPPW